MANGDTINPKSLYKPEYCQLLIDHMRSGLSFSTFSGVVEVTRKTLYKWVEIYPEFSDAKSIAFSKSQMFYEKLLRNKASGVSGSRGYDTSCIIFSLKTRFHKDYSEKHEEKEDMNINITIDNNDAKL